jgi:hypothetical protein
VESLVGVEERLVGERTQEIFLDLLVEGQEGRLARERCGVAGAERGVEVDVGVVGLGLEVARQRVLVGARELGAAKQWKLR